MSFVDDLFQHFDDPSKKRKRSKSKNARADAKKRVKLLSSSNEKPRLEIESIDLTNTSLVECESQSETVSTNNNRITEFKSSNFTDKKTKIHTITVDNGCTHEVIYDSNCKLPELIVNDTPAKQYKFNLDTFQKQAILCLDNDQSVLVSAHTSAGKTVVAEYAIALSLKKKQRIIYTTPIKALSNQKYRELSEEFKDVGLMTGDVTIDPNSSCIVMTTEILRNMLYRGSEVTKEVGWVIFDEIHYMRDKIRGIVWEETIILLPHNVRYVFLSATIPNAREFADWISCLHRQPCNVVYTEFRPTPLQHHIFPITGNDMFLVVDEKGVLNENNFNAGMAMLGTDDVETYDKKKKKKLPQKKSDDVIKVVKNVMEQNMSPLIIFSFSKTDCELFAMTMKDFNYNSAAEQELVSEILGNAINILSEEDKQLPHVTNVIPLLKRGIAFHHSGLLPIIKEAIEILFGEGLIKVLFATDTFAMGLNMPAKTVIFTNIEKFDGKNIRFLTSGEYIQMSGRAGRRGIDDKGVVIVMVHRLMEADEIKNIIFGKADPLTSAFHLTNYTILNLLRQEEINPEYIIEKSFLYFQNCSKINENKNLLSQKEKMLKKIAIPNESQVEAYFNMKSHISELHEKIRKLVINPKYILPFLHPGRLVRLKNDSHEYDWGIISKLRFGEKVLKQNNSFSIDIMKVDVIMYVENFKTSNCPPNYLPNPFSIHQRGVIEVFTVDYTLIYQISSEVVDISLFHNKDKERQRKSFVTLINKFRTMYQNGLPLLHPIADMKIYNEHIPPIMNEMCQWESALIDHPVNKMKTRNKVCKLYERKKQILNEINTIVAENETANSIIMLKELEQRKVVLRALGYCDNSDIITIKGRVACEFSMDELLLTEIILSGILNEIPVNHCVAILSCLLCQENVLVEPDFDNITKEVIDNINRLMSKINKAMRDANIFQSETDTIHAFQPFMINVILAWCKGASFLDTCQMTSIYEGSIIRYMRGIDETLKQLFRAAKNIGNIDLEVKFSEGIKRLKRGIVFAASLYL